MPKPRPKSPKTTKPKLVIHRELWAGERYAVVQGKRVAFPSYEAARTYASQHGYAGIRIELK